MTSNPFHRLAITLAVSCAAALSACGYEPIRTSQQAFCAHHDLGPNCEGLVARSLWWPDILIVSDASGAPMISCHSNPTNGKLQINAHVKNFGWSAGGPFWTRFDTSYSGTAAPETYYVFSGWEFAGLSSSGTSPFPSQGVLDGTPGLIIGSPPTGSIETDVVVTYESRSTNPAAAIQPGMTYNIAAADGPFTIRVRTNVPDPTDPSKPIANVNTSDKTVTCTAS